jgi:hypothetical protein
MKFVGRTIQLQTRAVGEREPNETVGVPIDGHAEGIAKERNSFIQPITSDFKNPLNTLHIFGYVRIFGR